MTAAVRTMDAYALKAALHDGGEIALLDARDEVPYHDRHLLLAACVPLSRLESIIDAAVPRRSTRVVWCDDGNGFARRAAARMRALGYTDVAVLDGGVAAWEAAGYRVYSGLHVPSKAFAEVVEHTARTPWIDAQQLKALMDAGADLALFDSRSFDEFHENSIAGAVSVPGAELVYRISDLVPCADTLVVVNCGGRTRSIIGAQSLIDAGVPNKVVSLRNGTQDWHLNGYRIVKGSNAQASAVSATGATRARAAAERVAARFGVARIDAATLRHWQSDPQRTTYAFDVRCSDDYAAGHVPGMKHVAGGQLVQETDRHAPVWGARVVLVDDDGVRALMTAHWMKQMGWDAYALTLDMRTEEIERGGWVSRTLGLDSATPTLSAAELAARLRRGHVSIIDVGWSKNYRRGHLPGAWYALRSRLSEVVPELPPGDTIVFTSDDGQLAQLAAADAAALCGVPVFALAGGTRAWRAAGFALETEQTRMATAADDIRLKAREQTQDIEQAMRAYLAWEIGLAEQIASDDDQRFKLQGY